MQEEVRFGAFVREMSVQQKRVSFNDVAPRLIIGPDGTPLPHRAGRLKLRTRDIVRVVEPYVQSRFMEQFRAVVPLAVYLVLFEMLILKQEVGDAWIITGGLVAVIIGLMLFMEGLKVGLMPFGEIIGTKLPSKAHLPVVLGIAFVLGIGVTFAEPAIGALKAAGAIVSVDRAPYLYLLLNDWAGALVLTVGAGVGLAAVIGTLRFLYGWSLKPLVYLTLLPILGLTVHLSRDPELEKVLGLAWDCGAVTTGPVTVPLVLSLGIGIAYAAGKGRTSLSGFGIVTLASLFPILGVLCLSFYVSQNMPPDVIIAAAAKAAQVAARVDPSWFEQTPTAEIVTGVRAIVPLVGFLMLVLTLVLRERLKHPGIIAYGLVLSLLGMIVFNLGLSFGLAKLGGQSGGLVPSAFTHIDPVAASPLYSVAVGLSFAVAFAWLLGFGATLAEPALNALGHTVESLTRGAFKKSVLMYAVSIGVGCGIALGVLKIVFSIPIVDLIVPGYVIALVLTFFSSEEFVNVAWDSAGVTTGPVTVPLVLAMGLSFGDAMEAVEGFGILCMASIGPIISVLATGLWIRWKIRRRHAAEDQAEALASKPELIIP